MTNCYFDLGDSPGSALRLPPFPDGVDVLISGERFQRPATVGPGLMASLTTSSGTVRLGPCPDCGSLRAYRGRVLARHPAEDEVMCVMES